MLAASKIAFVYTYMHMWISVCVHALIEDNEDMQMLSLILSGW